MNDSKEEVVTEVLEDVTVNPNVSNNINSPQSTVVQTPTAGVEQGSVPVSNQVNIPVIPPVNQVNSNNSATLIQTDAMDNSREEDAPRKTFEQVQAEREEARKVREQYQAPPVSKAKYGFTIFLFIVMFALVIFLPKISDYITLSKAKKTEAGLGPIVTGTLKCELRRTSEKYNINYTEEFEFKDSKLTRLTHVVATEGDEFIDADDLNQKLEACKTLESYTKSLTGVNVSCSLSTGTLVETQIMNYALLNVEEATTAFVEAGGIYPEYVDGQNIDIIEKNMNAASYDCERLR